MVSQPCFLDGEHNGQTQRIRFTFGNGSALAFGAGLVASGAAPNTFQNLNVSSAAADATVQPSGLCSKS